MKRGRDVRSQINKTTSGRIILDGEKNEEVKPFIPLNESRKESLPRQVVKISTKRLLEMFRGNQLEQLRKELSKYKELDGTGEDIPLPKEINTLLEWPLVFAEDSKLLSIVVDMLPLTVKTILQGSLGQKTFTYFLTVQAGTEEFVTCNQLVRNVRIEKFKELLRVDQEKVEDLMNADDDKSLVTEQILEDFTTAKKQIAQEVMRHRM